jgi:hypothetical protein
MCRAFVALTLIAVVLAVCPASANEAPSQAAEKATILFGTTKSEDNYFGAFERLIYTEAFSRLHLQVQFIKMSMPRLDAALEHGDIDIEAPRKWGHLQEHPGLIRVGEPVGEVSFGIYTANPAIHANSLHAMSRDLNVEFRRGIDDCGDALKEVFPAEKVSNVATVEQGIMKLLNSRTDLYCDVDIAVTYVQSKLKKGQASRIRRMHGLGTPFPLYVYLSKKNEALAPRLAAALKQMKAEGLFERFRDQARRVSSRKNGGS